MTDFDKHSPEEQKRRQERLKRKKQKHQHDGNDIDGDVEVLNEMPSKNRRKKMKTPKPELWSGDIEDEIEEVLTNKHSKRHRRDEDDFLEDDLDV